MILYPALDVLEGRAVRLARGDFSQSRVYADDPAEVLDSFRAAGASFTLRSREECGLTEINTALDRLAQAVPQIKKNLLEACVRVVGADGVIQESEAELLRGIAETLDCPMPPFLTAA